MLLVSYTLTRSGCLQATFGTQANALCRKNLVYQKRNTRSNCCIILSPIFVSLLLLVIQVAVDHALNKPANRVSAFTACLCLLQITTVHRMRSRVGQSLHVINLPKYCDSTILKSRTCKSVFRISICKISRHCYCCLQCECLSFSRRVIVQPCSDCTY